jgi:hypothetical protein
MSPILKDKENRFVLNLTTGVIPFISPPISLYIYLHTAPSIFLLCQQLGTLGSHRCPSVSFYCLLCFYVVHFFQSEILWLFVEAVGFYYCLNIFSIFLPFASSSTSLSKYLACFVKGFSMSSIR